MPEQGRMEHSAVTVLVLLDLAVFIHSTSRAVSVTLRSLIRMQVTWVDLRRDGPRLNDADAALLALAQALVRWNQSNAYSAATGEPMTAIQGGHARSVQRCEALIGTGIFHHPFGGVKFMCTLERTCCQNRFGQRLQDYIINLPAS